MGACFVNLTNHPSHLWDAKQLEAAKLYGEVIDVPFPQVDVRCEKDEIKKMAEYLVEKIVDHNPSAVLCQGEFSLTYQLVTRLKAKNILVLTACSERKAVQDGDKKIVIFQFEKFREY